MEGLSSWHPWETLTRGLRGWACGWGRAPLWAAWMRLAQMRAQEAGRQSQAGRALGASDFSAAGPAGCLEVGTEGR